MNRLQDARFDTQDAHFILSYTVFNSSCLEFLKQYFGIQENNTWITKLFKVTTFKKVLVWGEKLAMTAINIIEIKNDDNLVILDEIEDIAPNLSFGMCGF